MLRVLKSPFHSEPLDSLAEWNEPLELEADLHAQWLIELAGFVE